MAQAEIHTSNDGLQTSYMITGADLEDIETAINAIYARYHPVGYGTFFDKPKQLSDGSWRTHGRRANSCD